jgi:hypothetical protein
VTDAATLQAQSAFFHDVLTDWLDEPGITIACGRWADGAISEIIPAGQARLLPARYEGCFTGVRELQLADSPHHIHIDFGRVHQVCYVVAPSVCLAFKPSFELRFLMVGPGGAPTDRWVFSLMLTAPYRGLTLDTAQIEHFFKRAQGHAARQPTWVDLQIDRDVMASEVGTELLDLLRRKTGLPAADWTTALRAIHPQHFQPEPNHFEPICLALLEQALRLPDASLVIYRDRTLVEFKTEKLDGVHRYIEEGYVSWQIGALAEHHCHLSLGVVTQVLFSAEPVSCQGGGLNYTVWFLTPGSSGNPWRRDGYFSVVLNRPYTGDQPRPEVIEPMLALFRSFEAESWVKSDETFRRVLVEGPPQRKALNHHAQT